MTVMHLNLLFFIPAQLQECECIAWLDLFSLSPPSIHPSQLRHHADGGLVGPAVSGVGSRQPGLYHHQSSGTEGSHPERPQEHQAQHYPHHDRRPGRWVGWVGTLPCFQWNNTGCVYFPCGCCFCYYSLMICFLLFSLLSVVHLHVWLGFSPRWNINMGPQAGAEWPSGLLTAELWLLLQKLRAQKRI